MRLGLQQRENWKNNGGREDERMCFTQICKGVLIKNNEKDREVVLHNSPRPLADLHTSYDEIRDAPRNFASWLE